MKATRVRQNAAQLKPLQWTSNGFLTAPDGTSYCVQREQTFGAQSGGLIYYAWRKLPGEHQYSSVKGTTRSRETAVRKLIERMVRAIDAAMRDTERLRTSEYKKS